jgi:excisionase family DNA binding protein
MKNDDKVMTVTEVAEYLHVHPSTIYRLLRKREIPAFRVGSDWRFNRESIDDWRTAREKR